MKNLLPGKSVSIAAPASYWYLKGFPIAKISKVVDYIIYMTYDLHGQVRDQISSRMTRKTLTFPSRNCSGTPTTSGRSPGAIPACVFVAV